MSFLFDQFGKSLAGDVSAEQAIPDVAKNLPNSVADVSVLPPADWEERLRAINPKTELHSWLLFYWYRLKERWVLYDCVPRSLITPEQQLRPGFFGRDFFRAVDGPPPRELMRSQINPYISDAQHEMHRLHRVYACPFWVLEGDQGGHQVAFTPDQREHLVSIGANDQPPKIGSLPACGFDGPVLKQLQRLNRLYSLNGNLERLRKSGTSEAWDVQQAINQREVRETSMALLEQQLGEVGEMVRTLGHRSEAEGAVISAHGRAASASEAIDKYVETGLFS